MDFLDLIITIAILAAGGLLGGRSGKKTARRQQPSGAGASRSDEEAQPMMDFGDVDEEDYPSDDVFQTEEVRNETPDWKSGVFGKSYFTYEGQPSGQEVDGPAVSKAAAEAVQPAVEESSLVDDVFDLRKAIIYQTMLERVEY